MIKTVLLTILCIVSIGVSAQTQDIAGGPWITDLYLLVRGQDTVIMYDRLSEEHNPLSDLSAASVTFNSDGTVSGVGIHGYPFEGNYVSTPTTLQVGNNPEAEILDINSNTYTTNHTGEMRDFESLEMVPVTVVVVSVLESSLPLSLINFYINQNDNKNELTWTISNPVDVRSIDLEFSSDQTASFEAVHKVSVSGEVVQNFTYSDKKRSGYYRLKITDFDMSVEYSHIINATHELAVPSIYLDQTSKIASVTTNSPISKILVFGTDGKSLTSSKDSSSVSLDKLPTGIYIITTILSDKSVYANRVFLK